MKTYTELEVWKESRILVNMIYEISKSFPKEEIYGLISQIRRSAVSIPSNIAEGCGRKSSKETIQFLYISKGSLNELETQLYLSLDQRFLSKQKFDELLIHLKKCRKLLSGFINYFKNKNS